SSNNKGEFTDSGEGNSGPDCIAVIFTNQYQGRESGHAPQDKRECYAHGNTAPCEQQFSHIDGHADCHEKDGGKKVFGAEKGLADGFATFGFCHQDAAKEGTECKRVATFDGNECHGEQYACDQNSFELSGAGLLPFAQQPG